MTKYSYIRISLLREKGLSWQQIMDRIGCGRYTVYRALSEDLDEIRKNERERKRRSR